MVVCKHKPKPDATEEEEEIPAQWNHGDHPHSTHMLTLSLPLSLFSPVLCRSVTILFMAMNIRIGEPSFEG